MKLRDSKGRFAAKKKMVIVDEFGNAGPCREHERYFGYTVAVTDKPDAYGKLAVENRKRHGNPEKEIKASSDTLFNKYLMAKKIRDLEPKVDTYYIDKEDTDNLPKGYDPNKDGRINRENTLDYALEKTIKENDGELLIIVDRHRFIRCNILDKICEKYGKDRCMGKVRDSRKSRYNNHLQTHDYTVNATRSGLTGWIFRSWMIRNEYHKMGSNVNLQTRSFEITEGNKDKKAHKGGK